MSDSCHGLPFSFCALPTSFEDARIIIIPAGFDRTTTYAPGTRFGPEAIIEASRYLEEYECEEGAEISAVHTLDPIEFGGSVDSMLNYVEERTRDVLAGGKVPVVFGGEHTVTLGAVRAFEGQEFSILSIDAHLDFRDVYLGSKISHATVMRRCYELGHEVVWVGARSFSLEEEYALQNKGLKSKVFSPVNVDVGPVLDELGDRVYVTVDLDGFDPSVVPAVGTPEPGGLGWRVVVDLLREVFNQKQVIGWDLVELCPDDRSSCGRMSAVAAARLCQKMCVWTVEKERKRV